MKKFIGIVLLALSVGFLQKIPARADEFKQREAKIAQYKKWLDTLGPEGSRYWVRLDAKRDRIDYISAKASFTPTLEARNDLSIRILTTLPATRKNSCSLISSMRPRTWRWASTALAGLNSIHGRLALQRSEQNQVFGIKFFQAEPRLAATINLVSQKTFCYLKGPPPPPGRGGFQGFVCVN